jgi:hypothetical protein
MLKPYFPACFREERTEFALEVIFAVALLGMIVWRYL